MQISLKVLSGQTSPVEEIVFPMLPEEIKVMTGGIFASYTILKTGTIKIPSGRDLTGFAWEGMLPGEVRKNEPYVNGWKNPKELQVLWSIYERDGIKLRLMVTETPINHDVYIESYDMTYRHGMGDYSYSINFIHAIDLLIRTTSADASQIAATRPSPPGTKTYIVQPGDSLWMIAEKMLGKGSKMWDLYDMNKTTIDAGNASNPNADKELIHPGQVLYIPAPVQNSTPSTATGQSSGPGTSSQTTNSKDAVTNASKPGPENKYFKKNTNGNITAGGENNAYRPEVHNPYHLPIMD